MMYLLLFAHVAAVSSAQTARSSPSVDSIVVQRLGARTPQRIPLEKRNSVTFGEALTTAVVDLRRHGFFRFGLESMTKACGSSADRNVNRYVITVFADSGNRQLVIADDCAPAGFDDAVTVANLRSLAWNLLWYRPPTPGKR